MTIEFYSYANNDIHPDNRVSLVIDSHLLSCFYLSSLFYLDLITFNGDFFSFSVTSVKIDSSVLCVFVSHFSDFNKLSDCFDSYREPPY